MHWTRDRVAAPFEHHWPAPVMRNGSLDQVRLPFAEAERNPMQLKLNRFTTLLLLVFLAPVVLPIWLYQWITETAYNPQYDNSVDGDPLEYAGDKPIIISVWAKWASVWKTITDDLVSQLRAEYGDRCEFAYIEITKQIQMVELGHDVAPTVILRQKGNDIERFPNMIDRGELEAAINKLLGGTGDRSADGTLHCDDPANKAVNGSRR
jgi:hypothetical protein